MSPTTENLSKIFFRVFATALIALGLMGCAEKVDTVVSGRIVDATQRSTAPESFDKASSTPEASATVTATETPTKTATPTETATPEMKEPTADFDWDELIESMPISDESKAKLKEDIENQFEGGGLREYEGAHVLECITRGEMVIYDSGEGLPSDQPLVLETGHEIPATFKCAFVIKTASGELVETEVQLPLYVYHPDESTDKLLGYKVKSDLLEQTIQVVKMGLTQKWAGTIGQLERSPVGLAHPNQVVLLDLAIPEGTEFDSKSGQGYLTEAIQEMYSPEGLIKFAQTGVWPFVFETPTGELINLVLPVDVNVVDFRYP